jgi:hypothetical protein
MNRIKKALRHKTLWHNAVDVGRLLEHMDPFYDSDHIPLLPPYRPYNHTTPCQLNKNALTGPFIQSILVYT